MLALLASRLKLKLPGLTGNMSVNLPFILVAVVQLSLFEALVVGMASVLAQCFPKGGGKPKPVQMLFNVSTIAIAVGLASRILQQSSLRSASSWASGSLLLALAGASFFLVQTLPVATIISLSDGGKMLRIWSSIFHMSFPYYVLSAGVTSMVTTASYRLGWQFSLLMLPVMYAVYRSYHWLFARSETPVRPYALTMAASSSR